jgi:hypothetical protein
MFVSRELCACSVCLWRYSRPRALGAFLLIALTNVMKAQPATPEVILFQENVMISSG